MHTGPLNVFQRLARTWDALHPYNAVQACRVAGTFDSNALDESWDAALRAFSFQASKPQRVRRIVDPLSIHFTAELNRRFDDGDEPPSRAFVQSADDSTWLCVVYQHWVADSFSVRLILREWLTRLIGLPVAGSERDRVARRGVVESTPAVLALIRRYADFRRTRKVQTMGPLDYPTRVRLIDPPARIVPGLIAYARRRGVTVNDVFTAALAEACARFVPTEVRFGRRHLAVTSVVDLRRSTSCDADFGCRLGFNSVVCRRNDLTDWERLLRCVARNREPRDSAGVLWMLAADVASRFSSPQRLYDLYRKEAPFAGGISNVNLNGTWVARQHPQTVLDYVRVSPTGPMVPVAMNVTTLGDALRVSMTYRSALLNDWTAKELGEMFIERLTRISCGSV